MNAPSNSNRNDATGAGGAAVVLLSGGLDSAIMAAIAVEHGDAIWPLYVRQGFVWEKEEIRAVRRFLGELDAPDQVRELAIVSLDVPPHFASRWALESDAEFPDQDSPDEAVYLPGRNLALLTQAAIHAYAVAARRIQLGVLAGNPFPDATETFFRSFERTSREAMEYDFRVELPLAHLTKTEVLERGAGFPLEFTLSCIRPRDGAHCGRCNKCAERQMAFRRARIADPTLYEEAATMLA